jgi:hypothetical protein
MSTNVPDSIRQSACNVDLISFWSPDDADVGKRLSHFSMASAWTTIGQSFSDDDRFGDLDETFQFVLSLRRRWNRMSKLPTALLSETVDDITQAAVSLANKIQANLPELDLALGAMSRPQSVALATAARDYAKALKRWGGHDEFLLRPTKPNAGSAETTYCVKALTTFLIERTGQSNNSAVGDIVGALLDLRDKQLSADLVSKLTKGLWLPI